MAILVRKVCDFCGDPTQIAETVTFAVHGKAYALELCPAHNDQFDAEWSAWAGPARKDGSEPKTLRSKTVIIGDRGDWWVTPPDADAETKARYKAQREVMRQWGRDNNFGDLGDNGRVSRALAAAWQDAQNKKRQQGTNQEQG